MVPAWYYRREMKRNSIQHHPPRTRKRFSAPHDPIQPHTLKIRSLEKKISEQGAILSSIREGIIVVDKKGMVTLANQTAGVLLRTAPDELLKKSFSEAMHLYSKTNTGEEYIHHDLIGRVVEKTDSITIRFQDNFYARPKYGNDFPVAITLSPLLENQEASGALVVFRDISEEKEIDRIKSEFVSLAAHQLRTPIAGINWYTELLLSGGAGAPSGEQKKYLQQIYSASRRMTDIIRFLLNISRLELGSIMVKPEPTIIRQAIRSILAELDVQIKSKDLSCDESYEQEDAAIETDMKLFQIVMQNILSNAVKYTPQKGTIAIRASLRRHENPGPFGNKEDYLQISVSDSGYGIPQEDQQKIFTKLFRARNVERLPGVDGTGLGLYLTKSIVDALEGKIWFSSQEGKGTTFTIALPLAIKNAGKGTKQLE
ncbi:MAG: hypothetical protein A2934_03630 [Candidatus Sungbacteria bacterium RIFCSPLOWO2_01_FULL_47_10]|uniref:histidine kinase n=1 Tax=Candidatus Sungbacteria bacterium RIFCSPLOWO2_01_FULL_47_10 TaxID=1802276 RepID=A0A1G2L7J1_9BACT|nr:MAG: hypothetical protein A2934_03630 [Candidatus Sungbacteria bacterium RIFCSPLOWO2_01_FULL_47_10]